MPGRYKVGSSEPARAWGEPLPYNLPDRNVHTDYRGSTMRLRTLGGLGLVGGVGHPRKPLLLAVYLALEGPQEKRRVAELFWRDAKDPMASLRVARARLRSIDARLAGSDATLVWTDARTDAQDLLDALDHDSALSADGYRGPFLHGVVATWIGPELEEWILLTREYLAARARLGLLSAAERRSAAGDRAAARRLAEKSATLTALEEMDAEHLPRLYAVLAACASPLYERVASLAAEYGVDLATARPAGHGGERTRGLRATDGFSGGFVGRRDELDELAFLLGDPRCRLVTVHGGGGAGKTRLAHESARRAAGSGRYPDGVIVVDLSDLDDPGSLPDRLAEAMGLVLQARGDEATRLAELLGERQALIVLDNFEHLLDAADTVAMLLERCPNLDVLITSRTRLGLAQEWTLPVGGLRLPADDVATASEAREADAVRLFELRAQRLDRRFALHDADVNAVRRICRRVAGSPLAIELAAAWLRALPLAELADEIERGVALLEQGGHDLPARHRGLRATFDHSWSLLGERERTALRRLSVFRGGFRREAAGAVAGVTLPILAHLVDASLVRALPSGRFEQHMLVRHYARERLSSDSTEENATLERHATYYARRLHDASARTSSADFDGVFALLEEDEANVLACLDWAIHAKKADLVLALSDPLLWYYPMRSRFHEGARVFGRAIAGLDERDAHSREALASLMLGKAFLTRYAGNLDDAMTLAETGERLARASASSRQLTRAVDMLGQAVMFTGDYAKATEYLMEGVSLARNENDVVIRFRGLGNLVLARAFAGDYEAANAHADEALALFGDGEVGEGFETIGVLLAVGVLRSCERRWKAAHDVLRRADDMARVVGYSGPASAIKAMLANVQLEAAREHGDASLVPSAERLVLDGLALAQSSGEAMALSLLYGVRARLALQDGKLDEAERWATAASRIAWENRNTTIMFYALPHLADARAAMGNARSAARLTAVMEHHPGAPRWVREDAQRRMADLVSRYPDVDATTPPPEPAQVVLEQVMREIGRRHRDGRASTLDPSQREWTR